MLFPKLVDFKKAVLQYNNNMVYYHTSKNIKFLRKLMRDYDTITELSPLEYMKTYIEKCPEDMEDTKISWIIETFLGIKKHYQFLKKILLLVFAELSEEDRDYFIVIVYAIIFQMKPNDMSALYKCIFNISKNLLNTFVTFFNNEEVVSLISQIAQVDYDIVFVTENIVGPLLLWQPSLNKMNEYYKEYLNKIESRNCKSPTIPIDLKVLNRKGKKTKHLVEYFIPTTPPNSLHVSKNKLVPKSKIEENLKRIHEENKQKSLRLLETTKNKNYHFAQKKTKKIEVYTDLVELKKEMKPKYQIKPLRKLSIPPTVKETTANIKRLNKKVKQCEQDEVKWLQDLMDNCSNTLKVEELISYDRQERERERLLDIEKKHLMGQISHEDAAIAKQNLYSENKKKYEIFLKEKQLWEKEIEEWKRKEIEKNRKQVEKLSLIELDMLYSRNNMATKKKEMAQKVRHESEENKTNLLKLKQAELERRINIIKEIKVLAMIAKKAKLPKILDLTESSGLGLLCEMSIAELQERLTSMKIDMKEELEKKRNGIKRISIEKKNELEKTKMANCEFITERAKSRQEKKGTKLIAEISPSEEINQLKKTLEEKRNLRKNLTKEIT